MAGTGESAGVQIYSNTVPKRKKSKYSLILILSILVWGVLGCGHIADGTSSETGYAEHAGEELPDAEEATRQEPGRNASDEEDMLSEDDIVSGEDRIPGQGAEEPAGSAGTGQGAKEPAGNTGTGQGVKEPAGSAGTGQGAEEPAGSADVRQEGKVPDGSTVTAQGALAVDGTQLVDASGNAVQLKGISTHGLAWYPDYVNEECFRQLKEEWGVNVVRLAMYTAEYGGYCSGGDQDALKELVRTGVEYAVECGLYVIIDWHILSDGNPNTYLTQAKEFFAEMSDFYKDYNNVLYEICNEPNGGTSWSEVKQYAEQVIEVIRENDKDGIILVGTPNWSQYVDQAAADPITGYDNIMYTLHYYAATHTEALRSTLIQAVEDGLPVFVSEYGICDASGNGAIDEFQANQWVDTLDEYKISYVAWNLSNKSETSAVFKSSCSKIKGFTADDLSDSGRWLYHMLRSQGSAADSNPPAGGNNTNGMEDENQGAPGDEQGGGPGNTAADGTNEQGGGPGNTAADGTNEQGSGPGNTDSENMGVQNKQESAAEENDAQTGTGVVNITADVINSWGQGDETYYQYTLTITNDTGADESGWTVRISFSNDIVLSGGWNGNYEVNGNVLTISAMDYNSFIAEGGSVENIGFILYSGENLAILEATEL